MMAHFLVWPVWDGGAWRRGSRPRVGWGTSEKEEARRRKEEIEGRGKEREEKERSRTLYKLNYDYLIECQDSLWDTRSVGNMWGWSLGGRWS